MAEVNKIVKKEHINIKELLSILEEMDKIILKIFSDIEKYKWDKRTD